MKNLIGKRLDDRYEFLELVGVGGMANVYKAYDSIRKCPVAIKVLKEKFSDNEEFIYRFRNESKANASLSHPNIVRIFDVGFGNKMQYIVMEYIEGVTLKEYMDKAKVLNWKDVVHFTFQILRGLQHAHDKGIVHRDMKPQNIMLLEDGTVKIMDFGIARFPRDEKIDLKKAIGSVHYMSPEQAVGGITDFKSDVYSVGIMMYEMLTGRLPFSGKSPEVIARKHINEVVRSPLEINPNLPQGLVDIILRAIKKKPEERYQSAEEMLRDVDEFKQNPNVSFGYRYLDDIDNTKYFGIMNRSQNNPNLSNYGNIVPKKRKKNSKFVPILCGVAGAFFLVSIIMVLTFLFGRNKNSVMDIEIPDFIGTKIEEVKTKDNGKYKDIGYSVVYEPSSKFESGTITAQSIKPGTQVKSNYGNITFTVSSGIEIKTIPNVIGLSASKAEEKLKKSGFINIKKVEKIDEQAAPNAVISMDPKPLKETAYDTPITLYCNASEKEEKNVAVPNVVGKTLQEAKQILKSAGFEVSVKEISDSSKTAGVIVSQNKDKAAIGSTIELTHNISENKKVKKYEFGDGYISDKLFEDLEKAGHEKKKTKATAKVPLKSAYKLNEQFNIAVVDSSNNIVSECQYDANKDSSISFDVEFSKEPKYYRVIAKNKSGGKSIKYGDIKVYINSSGENKIKNEINPFIFSQISSKEED